MLLTTQGEGPPNGQNRLLDIETFVDSVVVAITVLA